MQTKKFFPSLIKGVHIILLVVFLLSAWLIFGFLKLIKGNNWVQNQKSILGIHPAQANIPPPPPGGGGPGGSTPFLAFWNGIKYLLENDFLYGKPQSHFLDFDYAKQQYESGRIAPDLYKIQNLPKTENGVLKFQIQEIEPEESFFDWLGLMRVIHPKNSEVVVDSEYRKFYVFDKNRINGNLVKAESAKNQDGKTLNRLIDKKYFWNEPAEEGIFMREKDYVTLKFSNLKPGEKFYLILKSKYRDWILGENDSAMASARFFAGSFIKSRVLAKAATATLLVFGFWLSRKNALTGLLSPLFALSDGGDAGGDSHCFPVFYKSQNGEYRYVSLVYPRAWRHNSEIMELPREAVLENGQMELKIVATRRHYLGFAGLLRESEEKPCRVENLTLKRAYHHRLKSDVKSLILNQDNRYLQTIPGDEVDLEFELPKKKLAENQKETYLIRAAGFYISLRPEAKKLAGNWQEKILKEARERLATASTLRDYK